MKRIITVLAIIALCELAANAQAGGISKGEKYVNYKFPDSIANSKTVLFPTATGIAPTWASDSVVVKAGEFYTYVSLDTLRGTRRVKLSAQSYVTGGAQVVIEAVRDTASTRSLIVQHSAGNDTISVNTKRKRAAWYYTGSKFVPFGVY